MNKPPRSLRTEGAHLLTSPCTPLLFFITRSSAFSGSGRLNVGCECDNTDPLEGWHADKVSPIVETVVFVFPLLDLERGRLSDTQCTLKITVRRK